MTSSKNSRVRLPMSPVSFNVQVEWHSPDRVHAAALVRDGQPWLLGGALVGMGTTPGKAVDELAGVARYLVIHGQNYLTTEPLPLADREWLFALLAAAGLERDDEMHAAIRAAHEQQALLVEDATRFALGRKTVWASLIQRHVRVGYARAVILLDMMEQLGVVGPADGNGKRDVLGPPPGADAAGTDLPAHPRGATPDD